MTRSTVPDSPNVPQPAVQLRALDVARDSDLGEASYRVVATLGSGAGGVVELATEPTLQRQVAIKRLHEEASHTQVTALLREAAMTGRLEHPNIVPIHVVGIDEQLGPVVVMKRVEGRSWHEALQAQASDEPNGLVEDLERLKLVCRAVEFAHSRGILHRDLKPDNVMLGAFGEVYVVDWGLAVELRETLDTQGPFKAAGTPGYMAPEMAHGPMEAIGPHSDIYQLGSILHRLIGGLPRHHKPGVLATLIATTQNEVTPLPGDAPDGLVDICERACAPDPADRYPTAAAFREAIEAFVEQRAARDLASDGKRRLQRLSVAIEQSSADVDVRTIFAAAQVEFEQSLRMWPEGPEAAAGRRELQLLMLRFELDQGNVPGARALVEQIPDLPAEQRAALEALEQNRLGEAQRLAYLEREVDPSIARPQRLRLAVAVAVAVIVVMSGSFVREPRIDVVTMSPTALLISWLPFGALVCLAIGVFRRRFFANVFNERTSQMTFMMVAAVGANRFIGLFTETESVAILRNDLLLLGVCMLLARVPGLRALPWLGGVTFLGGILCALWPPATRMTFYLCIVSVPLVFVEAIYRGSKVPRSG